MPGYIRGHDGYRIHVVLKGGKELSWHTWAESQKALNEEGEFYRKLVREWGYSEEIDRVYATRYDCMDTLGRAQQRAA